MLTYHTANLPPRFDRKVTLRPSGEMVAAPSAVPLVVRGCVAPLARFNV